MLRWWWVMLSAVALLAVPVASRAQVTTPTPAVAPRGVAGGVAREFVPSAPSDSEVILLAFAVVALDQEVFASGSIPGLDAISEGFGFEVGQRIARLEPAVAGESINMEEVAADTVGDWTVAYLSDSPGNGLDVGILVIGDGQVIRTAVGARTGGDIMGNLAAIARAWLAPGGSLPTAVSPTSYQTDGLWALLPSAAQLASAGQFSIDREWVLVTGPAVAAGVQVLRGSRENPVPLGTAVTLSDGWTITVNRVTPDATALVLGANSFNDPPKPGTQFFIANISATYEGSTSASFNGSYRLRAVGPSSVSYSTFENSCGVVPDDLTSA